MSFDVDQMFVMVCWVQGVVREGSVWPPQTSARMVPWWDTQREAPRSRHVRRLCERRCLREVRRGSQVPWTEGVVIVLVDCWGGIGSVMIEE
jgi:hypothetical protein